RIDPHGGHYILRDGVSYREVGPDHFVARDRSRGRASRGGSGSLATRSRLTGGINGAISPRSSCPRYLFAGLWSPRSYETAEEGAGSSSIRQFNSPPYLC